MPKIKKKENQSRKTNDFVGDLGHLEDLLNLMSQHGVAEFEWQRGGEKVAFKTKSAFHGFPVQSYAPIHVAPPEVAPSTPGKTKESGEKTSSDSGALAANQKQILSPFVGIFYRAASPGTDPYVKEGKTVKPGDVLCIIEAMKLMNEIEAEYPGKIISVLVENGQPVEFGEPLFVVET